MSDFFECSLAFDTEKESQSQQGHFDSQELIGFFG